MAPPCRRICGCGFTTGGRGGLLPGWMGHRLQAIVAKVSGPAAARSIDAEQVTGTDESWRTKESAPSVAAGYDRASSSFVISARN